MKCDCKINSLDLKHINIARYRDELKTSPRRITFKGRDGHELYMLLLSPSEEITAPKPALIWIYGGGWKSDNSWRYPPHLRYSADRGAVGVVLAYRNVSEADGVGISDCINDCIDGMLHLKKHVDEYSIDTKRMTLLGDSAGGHLAAWLALSEKVPQVKVSALVNCCGVMNLTGEKWLHNFAHHKDKIAAARKFSPLYNLHPCSCSVLTLNGDLDSIVTSSEAQEFHQACLDNGIATEYQSLSNTSHAFILPDYNTPDIQVSMAFQLIDDFLVKQGILSQKYL